MCTVDVERVVETGSNGYAWYVTFTAELESRDDTRFMFSPLLGLGANEDGLEAAIQPTVTVTPVAEKLVPAPSGGGRPTSAWRPGTTSASAPTARRRRSA